MAVTIRPATLSDQLQWAGLFKAYCDVGRVAQSSEMSNQVWAWIHDPAAQTLCLVAEDDAGDLVGFAHFRPYERPISATVGAYIDDVFVAPAGRGRGIADLLIRSIGNYAKEQGWDVVRWMTSERNYRARSVYDRHAQKTDWVTYQLDI